MAKYIGRSPEKAYRINGVDADVNADFQITAADVGAADAVHTHLESDITGLTAVLAAKSDTVHTHPYMDSLTVGGNTLTGAVTLNTIGDATVDVSGSVVSLVAQAPSITTSSGVTDANDGVTEIQTFVGTQAEWDAFTPQAGIEYIVYIHD